MVVMYPVKAYRQDVDNDINWVMHPEIIIILRVSKRGEVLLESRHEVELEIDCVAERQGAG